MPIYDCTLWDYLKISHQRGRVIPMNVRYKLFEFTISGAKDLQDNGFRHLDIKPGNVLLRTLDGTRTGEWNEVDCVLTDFGIGGRMDQETGLAGTPGFASPEQLVGRPHRKSDNISYGRMMTMIFCDWPTSWNTLYRPVTEIERNQTGFNRQFLHVVRELLRVRIRGHFSKY